MGAGSNVLLQLYQNECVCVPSANILIHGQGSTQKEQTTYKVLPRSPVYVDAHLDRQTR